MGGVITRNTESSLQKYNELYIVAPCWTIIDIVRPGFDCRQGQFRLRCVQIDSWIFPRWNGQSLELTMRLHLLLRSKMRGTFSPCFHCAVIAWYLCAVIAYHVPCVCINILGVLQKQTDDGLMCLLAWFIVLILDYINAEENCNFHW